MPSLWYQPKPSPEDWPLHGYWRSSRCQWQWLASPWCANGNLLLHVWLGVQKKGYLHKTSWTTQSWWKETYYHFGNWNRFPKTVGWQGFTFGAAAFTNRAQLCHALAKPPKNNYECHKHLKMVERTSQRKTWSVRILTLQQTLIPNKCKKDHGDPLFQSFLWAKPYLICDQRAQHDWKQWGYFLFSRQIVYDLFSFKVS